MSDSDIVLGRTYEDTATGFTGIATSKTEFLFACERVYLVSGHKDDGTERGAAFDAPQLREVKKESPKLIKALTAAGLRAAPSPTRTGGDRPMPSAQR